MFPEPPGPAASESRNRERSAELQFGVHRGQQRADLEIGAPPQPHARLTRTRREFIRDMMEVLASKTKCATSSNQLSGLGFSSTKRDAVIVKATTSTSKKTFSVNF